MDRIGIVGGGAALLATCAVTPAAAQTPIASLARPPAGATMAAKHIYSDPTMVTFEGLYYPENGELSPAYAPFVGTRPPTTERGFRTGGFAVPKDLTRADYRQSWAKMVELVGLMHKAGVPIVAGTDGSGIEIVRELETYVSAESGDPGPAGCVPLGPCFRGDDKVGREAA